MKVVAGKRGSSSEKLRMSACDVWRSFIIADALFFLLVQRIGCYHEGLIVEDDGVFGFLFVCEGLINAFISVC